MGGGGREVGYAGCASAFACALAAIAGCAAPSASLFVDVRTDLTPGIELGGVRVELLLSVDRMDPRVLESVEHPVDLGADYDSGVRAAELYDLEPGQYLVVATALDRYGGPLVTRRSIVDVEGARVVTFVLNRDCVGVSCPRLSDPAANTLCVRGQCVAPDCSPEHPEACPGALCARDADCTARVACATARCESGFCFEQGNDARCGAGEWCDPASGCVARPTCDPALCADADPCTDDHCEGTLCVHAPLTGAACDDGVYCNGADTCADGACTAHDGDPCPTTGCSEADDRCFECATDAQCGTVSRDAWSGCSYASTCAETGERTRAVHTPRCRSNACTVETTTETDACSRTTGGTSCGSTNYAPWSECDYADACDESAQRSRDVSTHVCSAGRCATQTTTETEACGRDTDGTVCETGGTYCGTSMGCRVCRSGSCVVNTPHYDAACHPSCGGSQGLCGLSAVTCCPAGSTCATAGPGPWGDCEVCCAGAGCF